MRKTDTNFYKFADYLMAMLAWACFFLYRKMAVEGLSWSLELLQDLNKIPPSVKQSGVDYVVCAFIPEMYGKAAGISAGLRKLGCTVDLMPTPKKKVANSFKYADQLGAKRMVFVAPGEIERGVVRIKDLRVMDPSSGEGVTFVDCWFKHGCSATCMGN